MLKNVLKIVQLQNDTGYRYKDETMMICQKDTMPLEIDGNGKVNHSLSDSSQFKCVFIIKYHLSRWFSWRGKSAK